MAYKQVILVRQDLKMPRGKLSVQVGHASVGSLLKSHKDFIEEWKKDGMKKVVLKVNDKKELLKYKMMFEDYGIVCDLITDAGKTFFNESTITCLGVGPDEEGKIDEVTGNLKML